MWYVKEISHTHKKRLSVLFVFLFRHADLKVLHVWCRFLFATGMQVYVIGGATPYGLPLSEITIAQHLQKLGYRRHLVGKVSSLPYFSSSLTSVFTKIQPALVLLQAFAAFLLKEFLESLHLLEETPSFMWYTSADIQVFQTCHSHICVRNI